MVKHTTKRDVTALLLQPPEMLLQGLLRGDISIGKVKQVRSSMSLSVNKSEHSYPICFNNLLQRCDKILMPFIRPIFNAAILADFSVAVGEFKKVC
ncbi:unnamed protein product [Cercopithifilaria johnstoni]|uniref:Uncharacterized protein n=1 Tax=Cercopithifilaria johnstoni TaxID=2874296 RepID=A0A8J2LWC5_9BILA|nr:unnamed protein product [Cercopithifilaria johnstoni]